MDAFLITAIVIVGAIAVIKADRGAETAVTIVVHATFVVAHAIGGIGAWLAKTQPFGSANKGYVAACVGDPATLPTGRAGINAAGGADFSALGTVYTPTAFAVFVFNTRCEFVISGYLCRVCAGGFSFALFTRLFLLLLRVGKNTGVRCDWTIIDYVNLCAGRPGAGYIGASGNPCRNDRQNN